MTHLLNILFIISVLSGSFLGQYIINKILKLYQVKIAGRTATKFDDEIIPLVRRLLSIVLWVSGFVVIAMNYGIKPLSLSILGGTITAVTTISLRESISNIYAGITLMLQKPFKKDDKIKLSSGEIGEVIDIGLWRSQLITKIGNVKTVLVIPNNQIHKSKIYNYTMAKDHENKSI